jgi:hypothetical protein
MKREMTTKSRAQRALPLAVLCLVAFALGGCEKDPHDKLDNPLDSGAVNETSGIYTLYDDEIKTAGGVAFIPGGENQSINLDDRTAP